MKIRRTARATAALLGVVLACVVAGCTTNPVTGESEFSLYGETQELALGDSMHPSVIYQYDGEYHDPELKRYLGSIVLRLHNVSHRPEQPVDFKVLNSSIFNAFAIPGHVYVTRGFLAKLNNEAEFAAVMGHEMAHYMARHSVKQLTNQKLAQLGLGALGAGVDQDSLGGTLIAGAGAAGLGLLQLQYGRSQEEQADRVGTYYLYRAGYEPTRAIDMQKLLHSLGGGGEQAWYEEYLSTHPTEETRLRRIREVIEQLGIGSGDMLQGDGTFADRWNRRLAPMKKAQGAYDVFDRAQAALAKGKPADALPLCRQAQSMLANQAPFHRLEGDIHFKSNRLSEADAAYAKATAVDRRYLAGVYGRGAVAFARKSYSAAAGHFQSCVQLLPSHLDGHYGLGASLVNLGQAQQAIPHLEAVVEAVSHPGALSYLGRAYEKTGDPKRAVLAYKLCVESAEGEWQNSQAVSHARTRLTALQ